MGSTDETGYLLEAIAPASDNKPTTGLTGRVLVVDDDQDVLITLAAVLRNDGHEVTGVADAASAVAALAARDIDVLVVDLRLGEEDGIHVLAEAVRRRPDVVGIVLTGYGSLESAIQALDAGAFGYLLKPCNVEQLKAAVLRGLEKQTTARAYHELQQAAIVAVEDRAEAELREAQAREGQAKDMAARAGERVSHLQAITSQLAHYLEPEALLKQVVNAAVQLLESPVAGVFVLPSSAADFQLAAAEGLDPESAARLPRLGSLAGEAVGKRRTLAVDDVSALPDVAVPKLAGGRHVGSIIVAPIFDDQQPLGVIEVYIPSVHHWTPDEIDLLSALAAAAGVALVSARTHEQLRQATSLREEILASVTHDLKTPLTTISGVAQLLKRRPRSATVPDAQLESGLDTIHKMATTMASLLDEVMDSVRLQHGQPLELNIAPVDLVALANEAVQDFQQASPAHELILEGPERLIGDWDASRLRRVLENLISNAVKYSPDSGRVIVRVSEQDDHAVVAVQDFGIGIHHEDVPVLFEPFKRGQNSAGVAGSGLGLVSVKRLVELHGGSVSVESEPGRGSIFTVRLPVRIGPG